MSVSIVIHADYQDAQAVIAPKVTDEEVGLLGGAQVTLAAIPDHAQPVSANQPDLANPGADRRSRAKATHPNWATRGIHSVSNTPKASSGTSG
ncbi:MAG: hypothetical protein ACOYEV_03740 [Candidatus Nanopelagicales bacterium]